MDTISRDDLKILLKFALHMAKVDKDLAPLERKILKRYVDLIGLTDEERKALIGSEQSLSQGLASIESQEAKVLLVKTLCAVAHSDGVMHEAEGAFIQKVNGQLGGAVELLPFEDWEVYEKEVLKQLDVK